MAKIAEGLFQKHVRPIRPEGGAVAKASKVVLLQPVPDALIPGVGAGDVDVRAGWRAPAPGVGFVTAEMEPHLWELRPTSVSAFDVRCAIATWARIDT